ncbi:MAG: GNAT family N-acetyltransferase [Jiangellales bacterium]
MTVRAARPGDEADIHRMVVELAEYERAADAVASTPADLAAALFGDTPSVFCHVVPGADGLNAFALWYVTYSTWTGRHGIWLEDLYVRPAHRGRGVARALLAELAAECGRRGYRRLEWWVLDWNDPALAFYNSIGATPMSEWTVQRLDGPALEALGGEAT